MLDDRRNRATWAYLNQSAVWIPADGQPVQIEQMDPEWRYNASRWLERRATLLELRYSIAEITGLGAKTLRAVLGEVDGRPVEGGPMLSHLDLMSDHTRDAMDADLEWRAQEPIAWVRTTSLYRALVDGLPAEPDKLAELATSARHYSTCDVRVGSGPNCTCPAA